MKRKQGEFDPGRRFLLKAGAVAGGLVAVFGPGVLLGGCDSSSGSSGGYVPPPSGGGGTRTITLKAHLESEYDLDYDLVHTDLVIRVRNKATGGVYADGNVYICLEDAAGTRTPIGNSVNNVTVRTGDVVLIGEAVLADPSNPDELERFQYVTGPYRSTVT